jgi:hypothetical protein
MNFSRRSQKLPDAPPAPEPINLPTGMGEWCGGGSDVAEGAVIRELSASEMDSEADKPLSDAQRAGLDVRFNEAAAWKRDLESRAAAAAIERMSARVGERT